MEKMKCKVVLLKHEQGILTLGEEIQWNIPGAFRGTKFHLYFSSNEKFKVGDYYVRISLSSNELGKSTNLLGNEDPYSKKVVATTDTTLNLPLIPQSFIEKYVESNGSIKEVEIEMTYVFGRLQPVVADYQNNVTILQPKETWTRDEVVDFTRKALIAYETSMVSPCKVAQYIDEKEQFDAEFWLQQNLK